MTTKLEDIVYPECAMRPERFASRFEAIDCANKTARLGSGTLLALVMVGVMIYIWLGNQPSMGVWIVVLGAIAFAGFGVMTASTIAERKWMANDAKITQIMTMNPQLNRAQAAETVVRENMQQEQNDIALRAASAHERTSNALMLNTGMNLFNTFRPAK
jgi:hypothetical protein